MICRHELQGCAPAPLAGYLKALGVLRLIAAQIDPNVRGAWRDGSFVVWTRLSREELVEFFLCAYQPTPMVSPWNKGSGLMNDHDAAVQAIASSTADRFATYRAAIAQARAANVELGAADAAIRVIKDEPKTVKSTTERARLRGSAEYKARLADAERVFAALKAEAIPACRRSWRGAVLDWFDSAAVLTSGGDVKFPALLGTGGNDGRLDMTNNAYQRIAELFDLGGGGGPIEPGARAALDESLFGSVQRGRGNVPIGQFLPASAGGANSTSGGASGATVNRWDYLLALEGCIMLRSSAVRRGMFERTGAASAPFAVRSLASGYASAGTADESARGEQWFPVWSRPASAGELATLFAESRAQTGRAAAKSAMDLARAASRLGVARGIDGFVRYGYIERNGQSNLAVSLGYLPVRVHPKAHLINELAVWLDVLHRKATDKLASHRLQRLERRLGDAVFDLLAHLDEPTRWQFVLLCAADVESLLMPGASGLAGPIPKLSQGWLEAADDGSAELRLGVALGSAVWRSPTKAHSLPTIRAHMLPWENGRLWTDSTTGRVKQSRDWVVSDEVEPVDGLIALVLRRLMLAETRAARTLPLTAAAGCGADLGDVCLFLDGRLDVRRIVQFARAVAAIKVDRPRLRAPRAEPPDDGWLLIRLAMSGALVADSAPVPADPAIVRRLAAGDAAAAVQIAQQRLRGAGLRSPLYSATTDRGSARLWAAALAFPLSPVSHRAAVARAFPSLAEVSHER